MYGNNACQQSTEFHHGPGSSSSGDRLLRRREWYNNMDDSKKHEVLTKMALYTRDNRNSTPPSMQATPTNAQQTGLPPPLQRYNGNTDEVHEYDSTLFEPAHNEQPDSDEEEEYMEDQS
ncbi:uncharacterized protein [Miscanthus floridulus]|uniref:uncharacterized protein isoform X2 n=1 Tax=Miscanthus floridulus TaxID=154761 RepID=UPI00345B20C3